MKGREFQICAAGKWKAQTPCCFLLKVEMQKVLLSEEENRYLVLTEGIDLERFCQVLKGSASDDFTADIKAILYRKPVQFLEKTFDV